MLKAIKECCSKDMSRQALCGAYVFKHENRVSYVATDRNVLLWLKNTSAEMLRDELNFQYDFDFKKDYGYGDVLQFNKKEVKAVKNLEYPDFERVVPKRFENYDHEVPFFTADIMTRCQKIWRDVTGNKKYNFVIPDHWSVQTKPSLLINNAADALLLVMPLYPHAVEAVTEKFNCKHDLEF